MADQTGMVGARRFVVTAAPDDVAIRLEATPSRPADDSPSLPVWNAKRLPSSLAAIRGHLAVTFGTTCQLCLQALDMSLPGKDLAGSQVDHIIPKSRHGTETWGNVQLVHASCNNLKNGAAAERTPDQYQANLNEALLFSKSVALAVGGAVVTERDAEAFEAQVARVKNGSSDPQDFQIDGTAIPERLWPKMAGVLQQAWEKRTVDAWEEAERRATAAGMRIPLLGFTADMSAEIPRLEAAREVFGLWVVSEDDEPFADRRRRALDEALTGIPKAVAALRRPIA